MITIYTKTHREACLDGLGVEDIAVYDARIDDYFDYVLDAALEQGIAVELNYEHNSPYSYFVTDEELADFDHDFMVDDVKDFWTWYN